MLDASSLTSTTLAAVVPVIERAERVAVCERSDPLAAGSADAGRRRRAGRLAVLPSPLRIADFESAVRWLAGGRPRR
jgi:hypothetical protein